MISRLNKLLPCRPIGRFVLITFLGMNQLLSANERKAEITFSIIITPAKSSSEIKLWLPYPTPDENQIIELIDITGNHSNYSIQNERSSGNKILFAEWSRAIKRAEFNLRLRVTRQEILRNPLINKIKTASYLNSDREVLETCSIKSPITQIVTKVIDGKETPLQKARALYDYMIDNFDRDQLIKGCGTGDVDETLKRKKGKCVDLHSVYVSLAREAGLQAREVMGIRIPKGLNGIMTEAYHCWAEVFIADIGWIPVDPSDVLKIIQEKNLSRDNAKEYREYYFGSLDANRIALGRGRNVNLTPPQKNELLNYFMYPYVEVDGRILDRLSQEELKYEISFVEI